MFGSQREFDRQRSLFRDFNDFEVKRTPTAFVTGFGQSLKRILNDSTNGNTGGFRQLDFQPPRKFSKVENSGHAPPIFSDFFNRRLVEQPLGSTGGIGKNGFKAQIFREWIDAQGLFFSASIGLSAHRTS